MNTADLFQTLVQCPFDPSHRIESYRLLAHTTRCQKQHPMSNKERCPFNSVHLIPSAEMNYHTTLECENRHDLERLKCAKPTARPLLPLLAHASGPRPKDVKPGVSRQGEENWDDEPRVGTYYPSTERKAPVVYSLPLPQGLTKSERRAFRNRNREVFSLETAKQQNLAPNSDCEQLDMYDVDGVVPSRNPTRIKVSPAVNPYVGRGRPIVSALSPYVGRGWQAESSPPRLVDDRPGVRGACSLLFESQPSPCVPPNLQFSLEASPVDVDTAEMDDFTDRALKCFGILGVTRGSRIASQFESASPH